MTITYNNNVSWDDCIAQYVEHKFSVTIDEIFTDVLRMERSRWDNLSRSRICGVLTRLGYNNKVVYDKFAGKAKRSWVREEI